MWGYANPTPITRALDDFPVATREATWKALRELSADPLGHGFPQIDMDGPNGEALHVAVIPPVNMALTYQLMPEIMSPDGRMAIFVRAFTPPPKDPYGRRVL